MTEAKRCEQCGREGTRGFRVLPAVSGEYQGQPFTTVPITECSNRAACQRRWRAQTPRDERAEW